MFQFKKTITGIAGGILATGAWAQLVDTQALDIALIRGPEPTQYRMINDPHVALAGGLVPLLFSKARNSGMGSNLSSAIGRLNPKFSEYLNSEILRQLSEAGLAITDGGVYAVDPAKLGKLDYQKLNPKGKISIYTYIQDIGVRSHQSSSSYQPLAYVVTCVMTPKSTNECSDVFYAAYGDGHESDSGLTFASPAQERWRDADEVYARVAEVEHALRGGMYKMAQALSRKLLDRLAQQTSVATTDNAELGQMRVTITPITAN